MNKKYVTRQNTFSYQTLIFVYYECCQTKSVQIIADIKIKIRLRKEKHLNHIIKCIVNFNSFLIKKFVNNEIHRLILF